MGWIPLRRQGAEGCAPAGGKALSSSRAWPELQAAPGTGNGMFGTGKRLQVCTRRVRRRTGDVFREIPVWEEEIPKAGSPSQGQDFQTLLVATGRCLN